jgi:GAF domain-containing protein
MDRDQGGAPPDTLQLLAEQLVLEMLEVEQALDESALAAAVAADRSCGITYRTQYGVLSVASSDATANAVDELQYSGGDGPCLQAMRTGEPVRVEDVLTETRWGMYAGLAAQAGIRSSLSYPIVIGGESVGALNLYSTLAGVWAADDEAAALLLSHQVAGILQLVRGIAADLIRDPTRALTLSRRHELDVAVGIVMARRECSSLEAREFIQSEAGSRRIPVRQAVVELLAEAELQAQADTTAGADEPR